MRDLLERAADANLSRREYRALVLILAASAGGAPTTRAEMTARTGWDASQTRAVIRSLTAAGLIDRPAYAGPITPRGNGAEDAPIEGRNRAADAPFGVQENRAADAPIGQNRAEDAPFGVQGNGAADAPIEGRNRASDAPFDPPLLRVEEKSRREDPPQTPPPITVGEALDRLELRGFDRQRIALGGFLRVISEWRAAGLTTPQLDEALAIAEAQLGGRTPEKPHYYRWAVDTVLGRGSARKKSPAVTPGNQKREGEPRRLSHHGLDRQDYAAGATADAALPAWLRGA